MILHVDMDAFYASIEERDRPEFRGKPLVVGGSPAQRGVVCAANYEARKYGIHSAMPAVRAHQLCPHATFLPSRMSDYAAVSTQLREILGAFTPLVEPLSLDEAFLDVHCSQALFGSPESIGWQIKQEIADELNLVASVGVAPNKFLAKIASDLEKPDGFVVVPEDDIQGFLDPLPIERIWGVGKVTAARLHQLGLHRIEHLRELSPEQMQQHFGDMADHFWRLARGLDRRKVVPDRDARSISHETTFAVDIEDLHTLHLWLLELTEQVAWRLRRHQLQGRTVRLKLRYSDFHTVTRSITLERPTDGTQEIFEAVDQLLQTRLPQRRLSVRLIGIGVAGFENSPVQQLSLFEEEQREKRRTLDQATDAIRERFGRSSLRRGRGRAE